MFIYKFYLKDKYLGEYIGYSEEDAINNLCNCAGYDRIEELVNEQFSSMEDLIIEREEEKFFED